MAYETTKYRYHNRTTVSAAAKTMYKIGLHEKAITQNRTIHNRICVWNMYRRRKVVNHS